MNTTAIAQNAVIVQEGVRGDRYEWVIQIPVRVTYQSASALSGQSLLVSVRLQRLETYKTPYGVAIAQFIAAPKG